MAEFRNILANGDLIRQQNVSRCWWWLFGDKDWAPYRNLSREVRFLEERMHSAHAAYRAAQEDFVVSQRNVSDDINLLKAYKSGNSEVSFEIPSDESIIVRREGVKYNSSGNNQNKQKGSGNNGNGNNQQQKPGNDNNQGQNSQQQQGKGKQQQRKPASLMELLMNTKVVH